MLGALFSDWERRNKYYGNDAQVFNEINVCSIVPGLGMQKCYGDDAQL